MVNQSFWFMAAHYLCPAARRRTFMKPIKRRWWNKWLGDRGYSGGGTKGVELYKYLVCLFELLFDTIINFTPSKFHVKLFESTFGIPVTQY